MTERHIVLYFGGNGHAAVRLEAARRALARTSGALELHDVPYPGFEGRPRAQSLESFLTAIGQSCRDLRPEQTVAMASGIGGLIALSLRSRELLRGVPLILQAPVLWGLEHRSFPRVMRWGVARSVLAWAFTQRWFQDRFERKQFLHPLDPATRAGFFAGYLRCSAFADFFEWFTPSFLRDLERRFAADPGGLEPITVWWGGQDQVVDLEELHITEAVLGVRWPLVEFPGWGHYPMIDEPEEWAKALSRFVETRAREVEEHG